MPPTTAAPTTTAAPPTTAPHTTAPPTTAPQPAPTDQDPSWDHPRRYDDCWQMWADGVAPVSAGEPGYDERLDYDGDGQACEIPW